MSKNAQDITGDTNMQDRAADWFSELQDKICAEFEALEDELAGGPHIGKKPGRFEKTQWSRDDDPESGLKGGGRMAVMKGRVFEKVGVNVSNVYGMFSEKFRSEIRGGEDSGGAFRAAGISIVAHMHSPHVPAVHMNTRRIETSKAWFGGGADLTPMVFDNHKQDGADFHAAFKECCDRYDPGCYPKFKKWCDDYFYLPHRKEPRGLGGIFYDYLDSGDTERDFVFTKDVGETFLTAYPPIVRRNMHRPWTAAEREHQLFRRGRYVEFNLLYDRGTRFGIQTGGNTDAILMSMPPEAKWP